MEAAGPGDLGEEQGPPVARVAEIIPELWLNRQGFFTMRGLMSSNGKAELDLVGYQPRDEVAVHVEVSASPKPSGQLGGETVARLRQGVDAYVQKKYRREDVEEARGLTCKDGTTWKLMLAHGTLNHEAKVCEALRDNGVEPISLFKMLNDLAGDLPIRIEADADYFAYLAHAYARWNG